MCASEMERMVRSRSSGSSSTSRIITTSLSNISLLKHCWAVRWMLRAARCADSEIKRRAFFQLGFRPYAAAMLVNDALCCYQTNTGAFKIFASMQTLEDPKQLVCVFHVEADSVVAHEKDRRPLARRLGDLDRRRFAAARKLHGIRDQIGKDLAHESDVAIYARQLGDSPIDVFILSVGLQLVNNIRHQGIQISPLPG